MELNTNLLKVCYKEKLDERNEAGMTPLMIACSKGEAELAEKLIKLGADINAVNKGYTPICYAVSSEDYKTVRRLVLLGADIRPRIYQDPIMQKPEIISCLLLAIKKWQEWPSFQNLPPVSILLWHGAGIACQGLADCISSSFDDYRDGLLDKPQNHILSPFGQGTLLPKYLEDKLIPPEVDTEYFFDVTKINSL